MCKFSFQHDAVSSNLFCVATTIDIRPGTTTKKERHETGTAKVLSRFDEAVQDHSSGGEERDWKKCVDGRPDGAHCTED